MSETKQYELPEDHIYQTLNEVDFAATYSYADYMRFAFDERLELIKGHLHQMSPAPSRFHQKILGNIHSPFHNFLKKYPCEVYCAPFDVRFPKKSKADQDIFTVL